MKGHQNERFQKIKNSESYQKQKRICKVEKYCKRYDMGRGIVCGHSGDELQKEEERQATNALLDELEKDDKN